MAATDNPPSIKVTMKTLLTVLITLVTLLTSSLRAQEPPDTLTIDNTENSVDHLEEEDLGSRSTFYFIPGFSFYIGGVWGSIPGFPELGGNRSGIDLKLYAMIYEYRISKNFYGELGMRTSSTAVPDYKSEEFLDLTVFALFLFKPVIFIGASYIKEVIENSPFHYEVSLNISVKTVLFAIFPEIKAGIRYSPIDHWIAIRVGAYADVFLSPNSISAGIYWNIGFKF